MADEFDIIDIIFAAAESANTGLVGYEGNSVTGEKDNHFVVETTGVESKECVNKAPVVNVNIFIRKYDDGLSNRPLMETSKRAIEKAIKENIIVPKGMYWKSKIVWSEPMGEYKAGFDCTNIRIEVITQLN